MYQFFAENVNILLILKTHFEQLHFSGYDAINATN